MRRARYYRLDAHNHVVHARNHACLHPIPFTTRTGCIHPAPEELWLRPVFVFKVGKPLFWTPDSWLHSYLNYFSHHLDTRNMTPAKSDPCVTIGQKHGHLDGLELIIVDDYLDLGMIKLIDEEEAAWKKFRCKTWTRIAEKEISFNGINISKSKLNNYYIQRTDTIDRLEKETTQNEFSSQRVLDQYVGVNDWPDLCESIEQSINFLKNTRNRG